MAKTAAYLEDREVVRLWLQHRFDGQGFSQPKLAASVGVSPPLVWRWLRDDLPVRPKYWQGIADFFEFQSLESLLAAARARAMRVNGRRR